MNETNKLLDKPTMKRFPKVELHRHLEGTFPVEKLYQLSLKNKLERPRELEAFKKEVQFPKDSSPDFLTFLAKFHNDWYQSLDDVYFITYHSVKGLVDDGLYYCELRFSPEHFALENDFDRAEITRLIVRAGNEAADEVGLTIRYLLSFNRSKQTSAEMIELYDRLKRLEIPEIVGIDLTGDEINYPPEKFRDFFALIESDGLYKSTIHAGEVTPSEQIWEAIRNLHAARIGHGTSTIDDPPLQEFLKQSGIALELCITSNYQTGSWEDERNHPVGALYRKGVPVTLNSDDPFIQNTDLTDDYIKAVEYFDFRLQDLVKLNMNAIDASFLPGRLREDLRKAYLEKVEEFKQSYGLGGAG
ncbi:MAG: adenosine deaminase [Spirochaetales bacterium]|nr:adenosine deaminase [Spirochaetales bacterium]